MVIVVFKLHTELRSLFIAYCANDEEYYVLGNNTSALFVCHTHTILQDSLQIPYGQKKDYLSFKRLCKCMELLYYRQIEDMDT